MDVTKNAFRLVTQVETDIVLSFLDLISNKDRMILVSPNGSTQSVLVRKHFCWPMRARD